MSMAEACGNQALGAVDDTETEPGKFGQRVAGITWSFCRGHIASLQGKIEVD